jgi:hypothetical protein
VGTHVFDGPGHGCASLVVLTDEAAYWSELPPSENDRARAAVEGGADPAQALGPGGRIVFLKDVQRVETTARGVTLWTSSGPQDLSFKDRAAWSAALRVLEASLKSKGLLIQATPLSPGRRWANVVLLFGIGGLIAWSGAVSRKWGVLALGALLVAWAISIVLRRRGASGRLDGGRIAGQFRDTSQGRLILPPAGEPGSAHLIGEGRLDAWFVRSDSVPAVLEGLDRGGSPTACLGAPEASVERSELLRLDGFPECGEVRLTRNGLEAWTLPVGGADEIRETFRRLSGFDPEPVPVPQGLELKRFLIRLSVCGALPTAILAVRAPALTVGAFGLAALGFLVGALLDFWLSPSHPALQWERHENPKI